MAKLKVAAGKAATGKQSLSVRKRQVLGAVLGAVDKIESKTPGTIHSSEIFVNRRTLHVMTSSWSTIATAVWPMRTSIPTMALENRRRHAASRRSQLRASQCSRILTSRIV